MCKAKKTIFIFLILFFVPVILCSETSILEYRERGIKIQYPEQVYPGAPLYFQVEPTQVLVQNLKHFTLIPPWNLI